MTIMKNNGLLLIEDDSRFRGVVKLALGPEGYEIHEAGSVAEGIALLRERPEARVILLDLSFADGSGVDILKEIAGRERTYRVIILTAHEEHLAASMAREFSVFSYLPKATTSFTQAIRFNVSRAFRDIRDAPNPLRIFISYTNPDFEKVTWVYRRLKDNGFKPWIDRVDISPGFNWGDEIDKAISECDCVLSCLSDIAVKRLSYFQRETKLAVERYDKIGTPFIIPLLFDNCEMPKEFVRRKIHHITYDPLHDDWWHKLLATLRSI